MTKLIKFSFAQSTERNSSNRPNKEEDRTKDVLLDYTQNLIAPSKKKLDMYK